MGLQFDLNLRRMACVSVAASIWEKELVKEETKKLFSSENQSEIVKDKWCRQGEEVASQDSLIVALTSSLSKTLR